MLWATPIGLWSRSSLIGIACRVREDGRAEAVGGLGAGTAELGESGQCAECGLYPGGYSRVKAGGGGYAVLLTRGLATGSADPRSRRGGRNRGPTVRLR